MICPNCHSFVHDGAVICPACHADLLERRPTVKLDKNYCPSCGALLPKHARSCPKCAMVLPEREDTEPAEQRDPNQQQIPDFLAQAEERRAAQEPSEEERQEPHFESAVPTARNAFDEEKGWRGVSKRQVIVTASIAAVIMVALIALFITRPWEPGTGQDEVADLSQAGMIETRDRLTGQDSNRSETLGQSKTSAEVAQEVQDIYLKIGELGVSMSKRIESFESDMSLSDAERSTIAREVEGYAPQIKALRERLAKIDYTGNTILSNDVLNLEELLDVLEKELFGLSESWILAEGYMAPNQVFSTVYGPLSDQVNPETEKDRYAEKFDSMYVSYAPATPSLAQ